MTDGDILFMGMIGAIVFCMAVAINILIHAFSERI